MSQQDKERWDQRWADAGQPYPPHRLLVEHVTYLSGGSALDLACGRGQNAIWLAEIGYQVLGVDISPVALEAARHQAALHDVAGRVIFQQVDLDRWTLPQSAFDLVIVFRFLDRRLFGPICDAVRPNGLLFYSTRHQGALSRHPEANQRYLLRPGELAAAFSDWRILHDEEGAVDAELIARKPAISPAAER
ncbi:MAG: class I SAM-dependent methyltransferase [Chloroflexota bacterium]|jgi:SAM-dependent methyltransferase